MTIPSGQAKDGGGEARRAHPAARGRPARAPAAWLALLALGALGTPALHAQTVPATRPVPGAGSVLRETVPSAPRPVTPPAPGALPALPATPPPAAAPAGPAFVLRQVRFNGNQVFSENQLAPLVADALGRPVRLADLRALAARVTRFYHEAGYVLAQVVLPPQDVSSGTVTLSVLEGHLGRLRIERAGRLMVAERTIRAATAALTPGQPLRAAVLERALLLLNDTPGLVSEASLEPANEPGAFDLIIELKPAKPFNYTVDADNYGVRTTREVRAGGFLRVNSPFGIGDNLDLRALGSFGSGVGFGRIGYEAPLGIAGLRAGISYAHLDYHLRKELAPLDATGRARVIEAALNYPFLRSRNRNLFVRAGFDRKKLTDRIDVLALRSDKSLRSFSVGAVYEARDRYWTGGYTTAALTIHRGRLEIESPDAFALDQGPGGLRTDGHYTRAVYQVSRLQAVSDRTSVLVALAGQWANRNLDSAEKLAAGGPQAVRAYASSAGLGDEVHVLNAEYRWSFRPEATASLFYDVGRVEAINHDPQPGVANRRTLRGFGVGLFWTPLPGLSLRTSLAWRATGREPGAGDRNPRLFAQLVQTF
ncbi:MAG: POTRA domain-containing protein [Telluria sp.]